MALAVSLSFQGPLIHPPPLLPPWRRIKSQLMRFHDMVRQYKKDQQWMGKKVFAIPHSAIDDNGCGLDVSSFISLHTALLAVCIYAQSTWSRCVDYRDRNWHPSAHLLTEWYLWGNRPTKRSYFPVWVHRVRRTITREWTASGWSVCWMDGDWNWTSWYLGAPPVSSRSGTNRVKF